MSDLAAVSTSLSPGLSERLLTLTEALAATSDQEEILRLVLGAALTALAATAGVVLLVGESGRPEVAAAEGYAEDARPIWQDPPLDGEGPAGIAAPPPARFFGHPQAWPELQRRAGVTAPVACAALPMVLDGQPFGTLVIDFDGPHEFSLEERHFLQTLAAQCALAVGRAQLTRRLRQTDRLARNDDSVGRNAELLAALGDVLQRTTSPEEMAAFALSKLGPALEALSMLVVRLEGEQIRLPTIWGDTPRVIFDHMMRPGLSLKETPLLLRAAVNHQGFYLADYRLEPGMVTSFPSLAVGVEPICLPNGNLQGFLVIWRPVMAGTWQPTEQRVLRRAASTLGFALERAEQAERLREKNRELEARTQALEGFALLAQDFSLEHDPLRLVGRAQELILSLLSPGISTYYELCGDRWQLLSHRGQSRDPALLQKLQGGVPRGSIQNIERPFETRRPYYQDRFDVSTSTVARDEFVVIRATAALPVLVADAVYGVLVVGLYETRVWSVSERAVLDTVTRSLSLALERSVATAELFEQRDALARRSQELQAANDELEAFTYSASHDLRTPVRHVMGFAELAQKALATTPNEKVQQHLEVIKQASLRMTALIDGMLVLSRSGRQELNAQPTDLNELVAQAQRDVAAEFAGRLVRWQIGELPQVRGDRGMLQQVMTNLLSNAVKYSGRREVSEVKVWAEDGGTEWRVSVQDNGVGFDPHYAHKLFGIFQRLHTEREFKGTGVGLATVRRIILKHGGQVFAESAGDAGATFGFVLPKLS